MGGGEGVTVSVSGAQLEQNLMIPQALVSEQFLTRGILFVKRSVVPASPNFICLFYESNIEGTDFRIMFICFMFVKCACFVLFSTSVRFDLAKSPEMTLCG